MFFIHTCVHQYMGVQITCLQATVLRKWTIRVTAIELFHIGSNSEVTKHGGGKTIELLCNMPIYNVLHGTITLQWVCGAIQCMNSAVSCVTQSSMLPVFIIHDLLHRKSLLSSPCSTNLPFEPGRNSSIFCVPFQSFGNLYIVQPCNILFGTFYTLTYMLSISS